MNKQNIRAIGAEVCAVAGRNGKKIEHFGFGIYVGDEVPHSGVTCQTGKEFQSRGTQDGKIILNESCQDVFFCECSEILTRSEAERIFALRGSRTEKISIADHRQNCRKAMKKDNLTPQGQMQMVTAES